MKLPKCLKRYAHLIAEVSDERRGDDGYWVYLIPGYWSPDDETHCIHEDNPTECARVMKGVEPCPCCPEDRRHAPSTR